MATKKTLLNEATIRRFMKLAELQPLANPFLENAPHPYVNEEEEPTPEEAEYDAAAFGAGEEAGEEAGAEEELELDLGAEEEAEEGADAGMQEKVKEFFDAVAEAATEILGVDTEVESDTGEVEDVEAMDIGPEGEEDLAVADLDVGGEDVDVEDVELQEDADEELEEKQGYDDKADEQESAEHGPISGKDVSKKGRRDDSRGKWGKRAGRNNPALEENNDRIAEEITRRVVERLLNPKA